MSPGTAHGAEATSPGPSHSPLALLWIQIRVSISTQNPCKKRDIYPNTLTLKGKRRGKSVDETVQDPPPSSPGCSSPVPVRGMPGSSGAASIVRGGVRGRVWEQHRSQLCFGRKRSLLAQESCVVFNDSITKGKSSMTAFFPLLCPAHYQKDLPRWPPGCAGRRLLNKPAFFSSA